MSIAKVMTLILFALVASPLVAQHDDESAAVGGTVTPLGFGRSRLHYVLEERQAVRPTDEGMVAVAEHGFRERWLRTRLPQTFADLESVDVLDRILSRSGPAGSAVTRERILEIVGPDREVERAHRFVDRIVMSPDKMVRVRVWMVRKERDTDPARPPRVEVVTERRLDEVLAEANYDDELEIVHTFELAVANGREGSMTVGNKRHFLRDFEVVSSKGLFMLDPVIDWVLDGFEWKLGAVHDPGDGRTSIGTTFKVNAVKKPIDRLEGRVGFGTEPVVIEKPLVARTVWNSETIVLDPGHGGFLVLGIPVWDVNSPDSVRSHEYSIVCRVIVDNVAEPILAGTVQGYDAEARVAFVRFEAGVRCAPGTDVTFKRGRDDVAHGSVREVLGGMVVVDVRDGEVRAGDDVR